MYDSALDLVSFESMPMLTISAGSLMLELSPSHRPRSSRHANTGRCRGVTEVRCEGDTLEPALEPQERQLVCVV